MCNPEDFEIEYGVLVKYKGYGGDVIIPDGVTTIGDEAFEEYDVLTSVTIPDSVTSIGSWAFFNCANLSYINIPNSVTHIGGWTFSNCTNLKSITIPDSVISIKTHAFTGCTNLTVYSWNTEWKGRKDITRFAYGGLCDCNNKIIR